MNSVLILILSIPLIEIYLLIKIGSSIGAFNTISLILLTAIIGVAYARYEGFNTLKSGMAQLVKNEVPIYEIVSGAALTFAAILLIIPITRKLIFNAFSKKFNKKNNTYEKKDFIEGEYKDMDEK